MTMQRHFGEHHDAIVALHGILTGTWAEKDPTSNIAKYPASYSETFLDMARAAVEAGYVPAAARIASLETELDKVTTALALTLPDTRWLIAEVKKLRTERDGLAAIIEQIREWRSKSGVVLALGEVPTGDFSKLEVWEIDEILAQSPADALAGVKAEAAATALDKLASEKVLASEWWCGHGAQQNANHADRVRSFLQVWAAAIRSEVK